MKIRLATAWFGGCSGCHMSFLDLDEFLIDLADQVEIAQATELGEVFQGGRPPWVSRTAQAESCIL